MSKHREIWIQHYCSIPEGWHIHHVDGDHFNNNILNLECVSPTQHKARHGSPLCVPVGNETSGRTLLAKQIVHNLTRLKITVPTFAVTIGVPKVTIYRLIRCEAGTTVDMMDKIAQGFGIPLHIMSTPVVK